MNLQNRPIKIHIKKIFIFDENLQRYYLKGKLLLDGRLIIKESQLCYYIFRHYGEGRYQLVAWQKGHEGFWLYWLGNLYENGFVRDLNKNKDVEKLKAAMYKAQTYDERSEIEDEIQFEKELYKVDRSGKRRGPLGLEKSQPGQLQQYEDY